MSDDQTRVFNNGDEKLDRIIEMLRGLMLRVESIETRLDRLETSAGSLEIKLEALETKVDERLKDTRPLWESVKSQLVELKQGQERIEQKTVVIEHKIDILVKDLFELCTQHSVPEERVERLERNPS